MSIVWNKILAELELQVSKAVFGTLFKSTALLSIKDNVITIATPSPMVSNLIEKRYYGLLQSSLQNHLGTPVSIVFVEDSSRMQKKEKEKIDAKSTLPLFHDTTGEMRSLLKKAGVRQDFTFENFAVSGSNQLAYAAATAVAKNLGSSYNPLFFYGTVGVGKTHLMQAIAVEILSHHPDKKIIYLSSEEFTNEFVESIRAKSTSSFRKKLRGADLLLIDDVQFFTGKKKVQEELFHTFNSLVGNEQQVILSSDRPPNEIEDIEKRLKSRFGGGLTVDIEAPDMELRTAILLIKAKKKNINLPIEGAKIIAEEVEDTRRLEGVLNQVASALAHNGHSSIEDLLSRILKNGKGDHEQKRVSPDDVLAAVCNFYGTKPTQLRGPARDRSLVLPRHIVMYLLKTELQKTLVEIGGFLGGRDHTTVMHGIGKIQTQSDPSSKLHQDIMGIKKSIWG